MNKEPFCFKQFTVKDTNSGMKICSDSVIFGAWINAEGSARILDIGTGTGILSLMLAQKHEAEITGIEICSSSSTDAKNNFMSSPWSDRLFVLNTSYADYLKQKPGLYDIIVCNPPWFNAAKPKDSQRQTARHSQNLTTESLLTGLQELLSPNGKFYVIIPFHDREIFCNMALLNKLYLFRETKIITKQGKACKRTMMGFSYDPLKLISDNLYMYNEDHSYSRDYINLTADFYPFNKL